jgi:hypothetical protein
MRSGFCCGATTAVQKTNTPLHVEDDASAPPNPGKINSKVIAAF